MARQSSITTIPPKTVYVVDTSYLLELFKVDGCYSDLAAEEVKKRFQKAWKSKVDLFVPLPCMYELGNHIADVRDATRRRDLANAVLEAIEKRIWTITPAAGVEELHALWSAFSKNYIYHTKPKKSGSIGLVDAATVHEARRLKDEYPECPVKVHIWTKDQTLKSNDPDKEPNPFVLESRP